MMILGNEFMNKGYNLKVGMFKSELHILCYYMYIIQISVAAEIVQVVICRCIYFISLAVNFLQMLTWRQGEEQKSNVAVIISISGIQ